MILKFGKYKGTPLTDVPEDYLEWLISTDELLQAAKAELQRRYDIEEASATWVEKLIREGHRQMALKHHPDRGGNNEEMKQVNAAAGFLRDLVKKGPQWSGR